MLSGKLVLRTGLGFTIGLGDNAFWKLFGVPIFLGMMAGLGPDSVLCLPSGSSMEPVALLGRGRGLGEPVSLCFRSDWSFSSSSSSMMTGFATCLSSLSECL